MSEYREIRINGALDPSNMTLETMNGVSYLVVPVVMLVEGTLHPANAPTKEFVSAEVMGKAPAGWNGRVVTWHHPKVNDGYVSANAPAILERYGFGFVFNARMDNGRLVAEAWLDVDTPLVEGQAVISRLRAGEIVELSIGAHVMVVPEAGTDQYGQRYSVRWTEIVPDHLALLPEGTEGACSVEMGCGTRAAMRYSQGRLHIEPMEETDMKPATSRRELVSRILEALGLTDESTVEESTTPGFEPAAACKCSGESPKEEEGEAMGLTERVNALIESEHCPFVEGDREFLSALTEERLSSFEQAAAAEPVVAEEVVEVAEVEAEVELEADESEEADEAEVAEEELNVVTIPQEEYDQLLADATAFRAEAAKQKDELISSICEATEVFTKDELEAKPADELNKLLAAVSKVSETPAEPNYAGRRLERKSDEGTAAANPPRPWDIARQRS